MIRFCDIFFSITGIIILFPLFIIISILITLDSKGNIFYLQSRIGKNKKEFKLIKFRTMNVNSHTQGLLTLGNNDSRITKIGYFLRKYKLDELPQLINVLIGEMSIVGPRPEVKKYVDLYNSDQLVTLSIKPGITDFASIEYSNENEILGKYNNAEEIYINQIMPHKLKLNQKFIQNRNLKTYLYIIFKTISKIL